MVFRFTSHVNDGRPPAGILVQCDRGADLLSIQEHGQLHDGESGQWYLVHQR